MSKIEVKVDDAKVQAAIDGLAKQAGHLRPVMQVIGRKVSNRVRLGFRAGQEPSGARWKPLRFRNGQPLRDTGRLLASITSQAGDDYVDIGTNVKYGPVHQFGAVIKPKKAKRLVFKTPYGLAFAKQVTVPARPFLPLDKAGNVNLPPDWSADVLSALRAHFQPKGA